MKIVSEIVTTGKLSGKLYKLNADAFKDYVSTAEGHFDRKFVASGITTEVNMLERISDDTAETVVR